MPPTRPICPVALRQGATREETVSEMRQAIRFHIESLREHGEPVSGAALHGWPSSRWPPPDDGMSLEKVRVGDIRNRPPLRRRAGTGRR